MSARAAWLLGLALATPAAAGIPCLVDPNGVPLRWPAMPIVYSLSPDSTTTASAPLVAAGGQTWTDVSTAQIGFAPGAPLPVPVDVDNYLDWLGSCGDGRSPVVFDPNGAILEDLAGEGASDFILGLTFHDCGTDTAPAILESSVLINGKVFGLTGAEAQARVTAVVAHELGHVLNLCHVRLHESFVDDGNAANDAFVPLMFPAASGDVQLPDPHPRFDDRVMATLLYPAAGAFAASGTVAGHVLSGPSGVPVSGAPVVVRSVSDPLTNAQWTSTGWLKLEGPPGTPIAVGDVIPAIDGAWQASLLPPGAYTVQVESGPVSTPGEFWSGTNESSDPASDPPDLASVLDVTAGMVRTDVSVLLPVRVRSLLGETGWNVSWRARIVSQGRTERLPADAIPGGRLDLFSTGAYVVTPVSMLSGTWRARGKRGVRHRLPPEPLQALFDVGAPIRISGAKGSGSADRALETIRGSIVVRGRLLEPPRVPFRIHFAYRGTRAPGSSVPGRVPLIPTP